MSSQARYIIASTALGAALGALLYRFGVVGLAWSSSASFEFPAVAASLFILGRMLTRGQDAPPGKVPLLGAGVVGVGAAIGIAFVVVPPLAQSRLSVHTFPGFTLALPSGEIRSEDPGYATGKLMMGKNGATSVIAVQWEPGGKLEPDELKMTASLLATALGAGAGPTSVTQVLGNDTIRFDSDKGLFELSMIPCGVRHVMIATGGTSGIETLHRRILESFACHPDPEQEKTSGSLAFPLVLDLPGWKVLTRGLAAPAHRRQSRLDPASCVAQHQAGPRQDDRADVQSAGHGCRGWRDRPRSRAAQAVAGQRGLVRLRPADRVPDRDRDGARDRRGSTGRRCDADTDRRRALHGAGRQAAELARREVTQAGTADHRISRRTRPAGARQVRL